METLIRRLLAKNRDDRPASAEEVIDAIRAIEDADAAMLRRRSRRRWLMATTVVLLTATGLTAWFTRKRVSPPAPAIVTGQVTVDMEAGDWQVVLYRGEERWPLERKGEGPLELPQGDYEVRLSEPRGRLRPRPGSFTVTAGAEMTVKVQLVGEEARTGGDGSPLVRAAAMAPGNLLSLFGGGGDLLIAMWDPLSGKPARLLEGHEADVLCLAVAADGKRAVSGEGGRQKTEGFAVWVWDLTTGMGTAVVRSDNWITAVALLPDGKDVLFGDGSGRLVLLNLKTNRETVLAGHKKRIRGVCVAADGATAVSIGDDQQLLVWDLKEHKRLGDPLPLPKDTRCVTLTADGRTAVTSGVDGILLVWDLRKSEAVKLTGHEGAVNSVALSADGSRLVSGGDDQTVRLWNLVARQEIYREKHDDKTAAVQAVALSADGKHALSCGRTVRLWRLP